MFNNFSPSNGGKQLVTEITNDTNADVTYQYGEAGITVQYQQCPETIEIVTGKKFFFTDARDTVGSPAVSKYPNDSKYSLTSQIKLYNSSDEEIPLTVETTKNAEDQIKLTNSRRAVINLENLSCVGEPVKVVINPAGTATGVILHDTKEDGNKDYTKNIYAQTLSDLVDDQASKTKKFVSPLEKESIYDSATKVDRILHYFNEGQNPDPQHPENVNLLTHVSAANVDETETRVFVTPGQKTQIETNQTNISILQNRFEMAEDGEGNDKLYLYFDRANEQNPTKSKVYVSAEQVEEDDTHRFVTDDEKSTWNDMVPKISTRADADYNASKKYAYTANNGNETKIEISESGVGNTLVQRDAHGQIFAAPFVDYIQATDEEIADNSIQLFVKKYKYEACTEDDLADNSIDKYEKVSENNYQLVDDNDPLPETVYKKVPDGYEPFEGTRDSGEYYVEAGENAAITKHYLNDRISALENIINGQLDTKQNLSEKSDTIYLEKEDGYTDNESFNSKYPTVGAVRNAIDDLREIAYGKTNTFVVETETAKQEVEADPENNIEAQAAEPAINGDLISQAPSVTISSLTKKINGVETDIINDLKEGDVIYITDTKLPDRWVVSITPSYEVAGDQPSNAKEAEGLFKREGEDPDYIYTEVNAENASNIFGVYSGTYYKKVVGTATLNILETEKVPIAEIFAGSSHQLQPVNERVIIPLAQAYDSNNNSPMPGLVVPGNPSSTSININSGVISVDKAINSDFTVFNNNDSSKDNKVVTIGTIQRATAEALAHNDFSSTNNSNYNNFKQWMHISEVTVTEDNTTHNATAITTQIGADSNSRSEYHIQTVSITPHTGTQIADTITLHNANGQNATYTIPRGKLDYEELEDEAF